MDDTDRKLMVLISENPRMNPRELAKRLGMSRQAVHHRMQVLTKLGVFKSLRAEISFHYLDAVIVGIWGRFKAGSFEEVMDKLGESEFTSSVRVAGGNELFVMGGLRNVSELDSYVEFVKRAAEMPEPTVGIMCFGDGINPDFYDGGKRKQTYKDLSPLDLKIIASLQDDARKPTAEIAESVGVSAKTVRRHLQNMLSDGSLDFYSPWDLTSGEDMLTMMYVNLRSGADRVKVAKRLLSKDPIHVILFRTFSNLPNFLIGILNSDRMSVIRKILREVSEDEDVLAVTPNLLYFERSYTTWDHRLPAILTRPSEKSRRHRLRSGSGLR